MVYDTIQNVTGKYSGGEGVVEIGFVGSIGDDGIIKAVEGVQGITSVEKLDVRNVRAKYVGGLDAQGRIFSRLGSLKIRRE